jgi:hypothetical protein
MAAPPAAGAVRENDGSDGALMALHGVVRVPGDRFQVDFYLYSRLVDAVAQARRGRRQGA